MGRGRGWASREVGFECNRARLDQVTALAEDAARAAGALDAVQAAEGDSTRGWAAVAWVGQACRQTRGAASTLAQLHCRLQFRQAEAAQGPQQPRTRSSTLTVSSALPDYPRSVVPPRPVRMLQRTS